MKRYLIILSALTLGLHGQALPTKARLSQTFSASGAPGSVSGNLPGDFYTDTTNHNSYVCGAASGTTAPACTSVTSGGWTQTNVPISGCTADGSNGLTCQGALTAGNTGTASGCLNLQGKTSGSVVTVCVPDSTAAGALTAPGVTGTLNYIVTPATSGHVAAFASDGIGLQDGGAASSPAWVNLGHIPISGTTASISWTSIPNSYHHLVIMGSCRGTNGTTVDGYIQFNGDTGSNYTRVYSGAYSGGTFTGIESNQAQVGVMAVSDASEIGPSSVHLTIPNYALTTDKKEIIADMTMMSGGTAVTNLQRNNAGAFWNSTAAITSILLAPKTGSFASGSFDLYGVN